MNAAKASRSFSMPSRREFLASSALGSAAWTLAAAPPVHAAGSDVIRIGLIGCGGRGSGAALNAMNAGPDVRLTALADLFGDRIATARQQLSKHKPEQVEVTDEQCFIGFDAYQKVIDSSVDVVLIAAASCFHPQHLKAAIDAGKHVFCEKPHGIDVPGIKLSLQASKEAEKKGLNLVSGLCWRYDPGVREAMQRVADGAIGEVLAIQETYITQPYILRERKPDWDETYYQLQNWYHFNWLSGDQTAQQLIHSLDKASWALGDVPPARAWGLGGRQVCTHPRYGDQFDHHAVVFEYESGVRVFGYCRAMPGCYNETSDVIIGSKGRAVLPRKPRIEGPNAWEYEGPKRTMYDVEHAELFDAIRTGRTINNGQYMTLSSMLAVMAQMVCYSGRQITYDEALSSDYRVVPAEISFDMQPPVMPGPDGIYPSPMPGV